MLCFLYYKILVGEKRMELKILSVDPGTKNTGYAIFSSKNTLETFGVFKIGNKKNYIERSDQIIRQFDILLSSLHFTPSIKVIMEIPQEWSSYKGQAADKSGSIDKLIFLCGMLYSHFKFVHFFTNIYLVPPYKWKGQLPKNVVKKRLLKKYKMNKKIYTKLLLSTHDAVDAVGIGDWYIEKYY